MNLVMRWDWFPGSTVYLVLQRDAEMTSPTYADILPYLIIEPMTRPGSQIVALKVSYWLPVD